MTSTALEILTFLEAVRVAAWRDGRTLDSALVAARLCVPATDLPIGWARGRGVLEAAHDGRVTLTDRCVRVVLGA